jgi:hypothetical protein
MTTGWSLVEYVVNMPYLVECRCDGIGMLIFVFNFLMYMWIVLQQNWVIYTISKWAVIF